MNSVEILKQNILSFTDKREYPHTLRGGNMGSQNGIPFTKEMLRLD